MPPAANEGLALVDPVLRPGDIRAVNDSVVHAAMARVKQPHTWQLGVFVPLKMIAPNRLASRTVPGPHTWISLATEILRCIINFKYSCVSASIYVKLVSSAPEAAYVANQAGGTIKWPA
jgi:hypothetical protein